MISPKIKTKKTDKLIEKIGLQYFLHLSSQIKSQKDLKLKSIASDKILQTVSQNITINAVIIAFLVGALTTIPAVLFEIYYKDCYEKSTYYLILSIITIVLLVIEIGILYWIAMRSVYTLASLTDDIDNKEKLPLEYDVKNMMVRSALEIEDPAIEYLGIDPQKHVSKKWIILVAIFYKAKIFLTSIMIRFILRKIATRYGLRMGFVWIVVPVTALWDAIVMYRTIKDAKLRLFGYHLSRYIAEEVLTDEILKEYSPTVREGCIRAVSSMIVLTKSYHPNNVILLIRLNQNLEMNEEKVYDDLGIFLKYLKSATIKEQHLLRSLSGIVAVFDGKLNKKEKEALEKIFGEEKEKYMDFSIELQELLVLGRIHQAASLCRSII